MIPALAAAARNIRIVMVKFNLNSPESPKRSEQPVDVNDVSRIAQSVVIKGDIASQTDIRIDGQMDGTLYSKGRIVVGESAKLQGNMLCSNVDFWGRMDGDIFVRDVLSVKSTAVINGNIQVRKLQVEMGAQINGTCKMISEAEFDKAAAELAGVKPAVEVKPAAKAAAPKPAAEPAPAVTPAPKEQTWAN